MAKHAGRGSTARAASTRTRVTTTAGRQTRAGRTLSAARQVPGLVRQRVGDLTVLHTTADQFEAIELAAASRRRSEYGATGTPNYGGYITGEDYNAKLDGRHGIKVWDEMRRSCAPAQASLLVIDKPILSAKFMCVPPEDGDRQDQAIADFCNAALFDDDAMDDPWQSTLRHLLLRHPMGFSVLEKVWHLDDAGALRPRRLAPRLPHTIDRWVPGPDGRLKEIRQLAIKDDKYQQLTIPADYALISVHAREGDNWWGRSVFRSSYQHWFYLTQFYRLDGVRLHRYGVGIPTAQLNPNHGETPASLKKIERILKGMQSHDRSYLIAPPGVEFKITVPEGGSGRGGAAGLLESVLHHADMIMMNVLASFLFAKGGEGVGTNRTRVLMDMFGSMLEAEAMSIAGDIKRGVVRDLCDLNFNMASRPYPRVVATDVTDVDMKELSEELNTLAGGKFITPDDGIEEVLRKMLKQPPMPAYLKGRREEAAKAIPPGHEVPPPAATSDGGTGGSKKPGSKQPAPDRDDDRDDRIRDRASKNRQARALSYTDPESGIVFGREPTAIELDVFDLRIVPNRLQEAAETLHAALVEIRLDQLETLAHRIAQKDARDHTGAFTDIRPDQFSIPRKADTVRAVRLAQSAAAKYGAGQVRRELRTQGADVSLTADHLGQWLLGNAYDDARLDLAKKKGGLTPAGADPTAAAGKQSAKSTITSSAKVAGERLNDEWFNRVLDRAIQLRRTGLQADALESALVNALKDEAGAGRLLADARAEINEAFALGRATEAGMLASEIDRVVYSALLDTNTCANCGAIDGEEMALGSPRYYETMPPYVNCDGNKGRADACRCVHLFIAKGAR